MCKRLPGLRCVKHTRMRLAADQTWRDDLQAKLEDLESRRPLTERQEQRHATLTRMIAERDDNIRYSLADLNAAFTERSWLTDQLLKQIRLAGHPQSPALTQEMRRTALSLLEGKMQYAERDRQVTLMPALPTASDDPAARTLWNELARHRSKMACARTQMALAGDNLGDWKHFRDVHQSHADAGLMCHAKYSAVLAGGASWWTSATEKARRKVVKQTRHEADFTTPHEPVTLEEAITEVVAQQSSTPQVTSVDPAVDTVSWAQYRGEATALDLTARQPAGEASQSSTTSPRGEGDVADLKTVLTTAEQVADKLLTDIKNAGDEQKSSSITAVDSLQHNTTPEGWLLLRSALNGPT